MDGRGIEVAVNVNEREVTEELIKTADPRDYIEVGAFLKRLESIGGLEPFLEEGRLPVNYFWVEDSKGEVAFAKLRRSDGGYDYLVVVREKDKAGRHCLERKSGSSVVGDFILDLLEIVGNYFPSDTDKRQKFFEMVVERMGELMKMPIEDVARILVFDALQLVDDYPGDKTKAEELVTDFPEAASGPPLPSKEQVRQLQDLLGLVRAKIPEEEFKLWLSHLLRDIPFTDEAYGKYYPYVFFKDAFREVVYVRFPNPDPKRSLDNLVKRFPVERLVQREVDSVEKLRKLLEEEPVKPMPDSKPRSRATRETIKFVRLGEVVGGPVSNNWYTIPRAGERGEIEYIMMIAKAISNGTMDINGEEPIRVVEVGGEYFVVEGAHRVAAMKALGVAFAPVIVYSYS